MITCEHTECSRTIGLEDAHSAVAVLQKVDTNGYQFYQCEQGQEVDFARWNHFHCSPEHMKANFAVCIKEHYSENLLHPIPLGAGSTILHRIVLGSKLKCKVCQSALETQAYRFCLTHCTPINSVPDNSMNELGEWCCSLAHAQVQALTHIQ